MRKIFDFIKAVVIELDGLFINNVGGKITAQDKTFYGFYQLPNYWSSSYGIDIPDEMKVEINKDVYLSNAEIFKVGNKIEIESRQWEVFGTHELHYKYLGIYRVELDCRKYCENKTT